MHCIIPNLCVSVSAYTKSGGLYIKIRANVLPDVEIWVSKLISCLCCLNYRSKHYYKMKQKEVSWINLMLILLKLCCRVLAYSMPCIIVVSELAAGPSP